ncbi:MAG: hypothetical protein Q8922_01555 [Bacteroidota bacterium]|nr:hypothetical protein [Bacteroidota bacterium]MDP4232087.1 hypothetical protein [Bacteroidota bacterium]MDP4241206.1 hypothetical protein [Bacteroidota bacterium]MDP4286598.1 hypothetical protein [Bacteroidota bacterium]
MKWSLSLVALVFGACRMFSLDPPATLQPPAVIPPDGSAYSYSYFGTGSDSQPDTLLERVRMSTCPGGFIAHRTSDVLAGFSTAKDDTLIVRSDGDLMSQCGCDAIYPVHTQSTYTITTTGPATLNGIACNEEVANKYTYLGTDTIRMGDSVYPCTKTSRETHVIPADPASGAVGFSASITYWYSANVGYFLKEQSVSGDAKSKNYTRVLTSYKLGH